MKVSTCNDVNDKVVTGPVLVSFGEKASFLDWVPINCIQDWVIITAYLTCFAAGDFRLKCRAITSPFTLQLIFATAAAVLLDSFNISLHT